MFFLLINHNAGSPSRGPNYRSHRIALSLIESGHSVLVVSSSKSQKLSSPPTISGLFSLTVEDNVPFLWLQNIPLYSLSSFQIYSFGIQLFLVLFIFIINPTLFLPPPHLFGFFNQVSFYFTELALFLNLETYGLIY